MESILGSIPPRTNQVFLRNDYRGHPNPYGDPVMNFRLLDARLTHFGKAFQNRAAHIIDRYDTFESKEHQAVDRLVASGVDINDWNYQRTGKNLLQIAIESHRVSRAQRLIEHGAEIKPIHIETAIKHAVSMSMVKLLYSKTNFADVQFDRFDNLLNALHLACKYNRLEVVKFLVQNGFDVNRRNKARQAPLHFAAQNGSKDIAKFLLDNNANADCIELDSPMGLSPFTYAASLGHTGFVKYFVEERQYPVDKGSASDMSALYHAVMAGQKDLVRQLIRLGADVNKVSYPFEKSPSACAIDNRDFEMLEILFEAGADIMAQHFHCLDSMKKISLFDYAHQKKFGEAKKLIRDYKELYSTLIRDIESGKSFSIDPALEDLFDKLVRDSYKESSPYQSKLFKTLYLALNQSHRKLLKDLPQVERLSEDNSSEMSPSELFSENHFKVEQAKKNAKTHQKEPSWIGKLLDLFKNAVSAFFDKISVAALWLLTKLNLYHPNELPRFAMMQCPTELTTEQETQVTTVALSQPSAMLSFSQCPQSILGTNLVQENVLGENERKVSLS